MLNGRVEFPIHESRLLADNPLDDSARREVGVYLPPSYTTDSARRYPVVYMLAGYTGHGPSNLTSRSPWTPTLAERIDRLITRKEMPEAIVVHPDCFTRYGGSQYVDSPAIGRYHTYVTDEIVSFVDKTYRTIPTREGRAILGKSSGGYGALIFAMARPDLFSAMGSHAGDSAFELCYARELPVTVVALMKKGGIKAYLDWFDAQPSKPGHSIEVMSNLCCAAAWTPRASGPYNYGTGFELPIDLTTGVFIDALWQRWLAADPVRMLDKPANLDAMRKMRAIYLDAGLSDEYMLQLGTRQIRDKLKAAGIACTHEEFDAGHMNVQYRYERSLVVLTRALAGAA